MKLFPVLIAAAAIVAAGCGGGGDTTTSAGTATTPAPPPPADTTGTVPDFGEGGGGAGEKYPPEAREAFISSCSQSSGGRSDACECALEEIEKSLSFAEFVKVNQELATGGEPPKEIQQAIETCG